MQDKMQIEILADGRIKVTVDGHVSMPNHLNAEQMLGFMGRLAGGKVDTQKLKHAHHHHEQHINIKA